MDGTGSDRSRRPAAGRVLAALSVMPALALSGWLLAGFPLLLLGWFRPAVMLPIGGLLAAALCAAGARLTRRGGRPDTTAWQVTGVVAVALGSAVFNALLHSEQLVVRRDPATYAQYAIWLAKHGSLPIPWQEAAFGGADPALRFASVGFYDQGGAVVPQFMPGTPMVLAAGHWLGGLTGLLLTPAVLGGLAVLTVAGVAARLAGPRWAPLAALVSAISLPLLYTSRTTFSEIPSLILIFGAVALALDARRRPAAAALGGLAFGLAVMVRVDALRDVLPALAYAGLLIALRRAGGRAAPYARTGPPLLAGLVAGLVLAMLAAVLLARPYLAYLSGSVLPLLAICGVVLMLTAAGALAGPAAAAAAARALRSGWPGRRLPDLAAGLVVVVVLAFAARPWVQTVRRTPVDPEDVLNATFIRSIQQDNGLPLDMTRLYYEQSLYWVIWYVGVPAVALATLAAAVLARRMARGRSFAWLLPLMIIGWTSVTTLLRPAITPDHPFAARRLVPVIIPGLVLLAVWGLRWLWEGARRSGYPWRAVLAGGVALLVVPAAVTSIGTGFSPVERGELAAADRLCAALPPDASVLIIERVTGDRFTQLVRGMCGRPAAQLAVPAPGTASAAGKDVAAPADVVRLAAKVRAAGRRPVLLAAAAGQLAPYGTPRQIMGLRTRQDERSLVEPPDGTWSLAMDVWMAVPAG
ncbi:hypothetical protein Sru01_04100 [Sphaerisporangium rufum]|uniref:Glycosyltransferase RgtA/B/C/D-like domain-containing protein n=1 Tax=Sphaerisporangium rufum TaxID=1381558 RepID=A0A919QY63_9ACTN|nr:hypothetical protein [Sphaerisporangium rufum]GII75428.1 hypothetical protein Sru01_04100 [Sphaerisporangium rufum]